MGLRKLSKASTNRAVKAAKSSGGKGFGAPEVASVTGPNRGDNSAGKGFGAPEVEVVNSLNSSEDSTRQGRVGRGVEGSEGGLSASEHTMNSFARNAGSVVDPVVARNEMPGEDDDANSSGGEGCVANGGGLLGGNAEIVGRTDSAVVSEERGAVLGPINQGSSSSVDASSHLQRSSSSSSSGGGSKDPSGLTWGRSISSSSSMGTSSSDQGSSSSSRVALGTDQRNNVATSGTEELAGGHGHSGAGPTQVRVI